jgi:small-conductance mechanosensitive channel
VVWITDDAICDLLDLLDEYPRKRVRKLIRRLQRLQCDVAKARNAEGAEQQRSHEEQMKHRSERLQQTVTGYLRQDEQQISALQQQIKRLEEQLTATAPSVCFWRWIPWHSRRLLCPVKF